MVRLKGLAPYICRRTLVNQVLPGYPLQPAGSCQLFLAALPDGPQHDVGNSADMLLGQLVEHINFINPVEELRRLKRRLPHPSPVLHEIVICLGIACHTESKTLGDMMFRLRIACHDDDSILK